MSFVLKDKTVIGNCKSLKIYDKTGVFNASTNTTGYGSPNPTIGDVQTTVIRITVANSATPYEFNAYPTLPNTDDTPFIITASQLGYTTIPDQAIFVEYIITGILNSQPFTYTIGCYVPVTCSMDCCLDNLVDAASEEITCSCPSICDCTCGCKDAIMQETRMKVLVTGYKKLVKNNLINKSKVVLSLINSICACNT